jgi:hypothetical protein
VYVLEFLVCFCFTRLLFAQLWAVRFAVCPRLALERLACFSRNSPTNKIFGFVDKDARTNVCVCGKKPVDSVFDQLWPDTVLASHSSVLSVLHRLCGEQTQTNVPEIVRLIRTSTLKGECMRFQKSIHVT